MTQAAPLFAASQIAAALGRKRQAIARTLESVVPSGSILNGGNPANAWHLHALPLKLQADLRALAARKGYRSAEALLNEPLKRWEPALPMPLIAEDCIANAARLQRAFSATFQRVHETHLSESEIEQKGVADYQAEFGHPISARHWRRLFKRTIERDNGAGEFARLELYVPEKPARKTVPVPNASKGTIPSLDKFVASLKDPVQPSAEELTLFWLRVCEHYSDECERQPKAKSELLDYLCARVPFLSTSREANAKQLQRKLQKWIDSAGDISELKDKRSQSSGWHRGPQISDEDRDTLLAAAVLKHGSRVAPALRECIKEGKLSPELTEHYSGKNANKSAIAPRIRDAVLPQAKAMIDIHHGPRQAKLNGPHIKRRYNFHSMDWWQADDITLPVVYAEANADGSTELMRGQVLLFVDLRSGFVLGFKLLSSRNYNAVSIRTLITRLCDEWGMPRCGFYFEKSMWENARILKGDSRAGEVRPWSESETGLREHFQFIHAQLPRAKPIERIIGALQNLMEGEPGYVGRNEMIEKFERTQKAIRLVKNGKIESGQCFYTGEQWTERFWKICDQYNNEPQQGVMTNGLSPAEAFHQFRKIDDPPTRLDPRCRHVLANHKKPVRITAKGVSFEFRRETFRYFDEQTGRLIGHELLAWWDPELPEVITLTDMDGKNAFSVARANDVPAIDGGELLNIELKRGVAHMTPIRERYRHMRSNHKQEFRVLQVDRATAELGSAIRNNSAAVLENQKQNERTQSDVRKAARDLNIAIDPQAIRRPGQIEAMKRLAARMSKEPSNQ